MNYRYNLNISNLFNYLLLVIAMFPLIGMRITVMIIILWCLISLIIGIKEKLYKNFFSQWKSLLFLGSYYLLSVISFILFSENEHEGIKDLETKASFLIFPLFFYLSRDRIKTKMLFYSLLSFAISNLILALYVWGLIFNEGIMNLLERDTYYHPVFRAIFGDTLGIHLPYLGLLFGFSIIIFVYTIATKLKRNSHKLLLSFGIMVLLVSMFIFSARMAIFATIMALSFYYISREWKNKRRIIVFFGLCSVLIFSLSLLPPIKRRIDSLKNIEFKLPDASQKAHQVNFRYGVYYCSKNILEEHWLLGLGQGSVQDMLDKCYDNFDYKGFDNFKVQKYNSHNQYLNEWMTHGILGLLFFLFYLGYCFRSGDLLYKSFILLFSIALLTENLFEREVGVVFFSFFNTFFFIKNMNKEQRSIKE